MMSISVKQSEDVEDVKVFSERENEALIPFEEVLEDLDGVVKGKL